MRILLKFYCATVIILLFVAKVDKTRKMGNDICTNLLTNLIQDIRKKHKKGEYRQSIKYFYWNESMFREIWLKMGLKKANFEAIVDRNCSG